MRPLALVLLVVAAAPAEEWRNRRKPHRFEAPGGKRVLVARRSDDRKSMLFEIRTADGKVLGQGTYSPMPDDVWPLQKQAGAVVCDVFRRRGSGDALAFVEKDGHVRWRVAFRDLFTGAEIEAFAKDVWGYDWLFTWWVDAPESHVVLVTRTGIAVAVATADGAVRRPDSLVGIRPHVPDRFLEAAVLRGEKAAAEQARLYLRRASTPVATRLRAAVLLHTVDQGPAPARELFDAAIAKDEASDDRAWALHAAARHMDDGPAAWLADAALREGIAEPALEALGSLGEPALPTLVGLLTSAKLSGKARAFAARQVEGMPADRLLQAILRDLKNAREDPAAAGPLLLAAVTQPVPDLAERLQSYESTLIKVLDKDTGPTGWIADYFAQIPSSEAIKPLLRQLQRHRTDAYRGRIIRALKSCTGQDFGDNVDAWLKNTILR